MKVAQFIEVNVSSGSRAASYGERGGP